MTLTQYAKRDWVRGWLAERLTKQCSCQYHVIIKMYWAVVRSKDVHWPSQASAVSLGRSLVVRFHPHFKYDVLPTIYCAYLALRLTSSPTVFFVDQICRTMEAINVTASSALPLSRSSQYGPITISVVAIIALAIINFMIRFVRYRQEFREMVRTSGGSDRPMLT